MPWKNNGLSLEWTRSSLWNRNKEKITAEQYITNLKESVDKHKGSICTGGRNVSLPEQSIMTWLYYAGYSSAKWHKIYIDKEKDLEIEEKSLENEVDKQALIVGNPEIENIVNICLWDPTQKSKINKLCAVGLTGGLTKAFSQDLCLQNNFIQHKHSGNKD